MSDFGDSDEFAATRHFIGHETRRLHQTLLLKVMVRMASTGSCLAQGCRIWMIDSVSR